MKLHQTLAAKIFVISFITTHIPLLTLLGVIVLYPNVISPLVVLLCALGATLVATFVLIFGLHRLFLPLRKAADGLGVYLTTGQPLRYTQNGTDEMSQLLRLLVSSLGHIERSRAGLIARSAIGLQNVIAENAALQKDSPSHLALVDLDQWPLVEARVPLSFLVQASDATQRRIADILIHEGEMTLPWGRGRNLVLLRGSSDYVKQRLQPLLSGFNSSSSPSKLTCSVAIESIESTELHQAQLEGVLRTLDRKLISVRAESQRGQVS